mmetsp:Transcript_116971/g.174711  ORF Transcript_116971/g.174711 Transcript_116971/m.174711 type:complete len:85 (-) Transcript_116971:62-316(-)
MPTREHDHDPPNKGHMRAKHCRLTRLRRTQMKQRPKQLPSGQPVTQQDTFCTCAHLKPPGEGLDVAAAASSSSPTALGLGRPVV